MNKQNIIKILSIVVMVTAILVMFGWFFDITALKSILPFWVTMKFTTALSFLLSGIILFFVNEYLNERKEIARIVLPITVLIILLLMATLLTSVFMGIRTGIEDLFVKEAEGAVKSTTPGRPSVGTMVNFILMAAAGILLLLNVTKLKDRLFWIGGAITFIGSIAIIGYVINVPVLYYTLGGWSSAMAFHTALLFVMLGFGLILMKKTPVGVSYT